MHFCDRFAIQRIEADFRFWEWIDAFGVQFPNSVMYYSFVSLVSRLVLHVFCGGPADLHMALHWPVSIFIGTEFAIVAFVIYFLEFLDLSA